MTTRVPSLFDDNGEFTPATRSTDVSRPPDPPSVAILEARELMRSIPEKLARVNDPTLALPKKLEILSEIISSMIVPLMDEALSDSPSAERALVFSRLLAYVKEVSGQLNKKYDVEESDDINPYSQKFQTIFEWFLDLIQQSMVEQRMDPILMNNVFNSMHDNLIGWEDKVSRSLRGISGKALAKVENPFVKDFIRGLKEEDV